MSPVFRPLHRQLLQSISKVANKAPAKPSLHHYLGRNSMAGRLTLVLMPIRYRWVNFTSSDRWRLLSLTLSGGGSQQARAGTLRSKEPIR